MAFIFLIHTLCYLFYPNHRQVEAIAGASWSQIEQLTIVVRQPDAKEGAGSSACKIEREANHQTSHDDVRNRRGRSHHFDSGRL